MRYLDLRFSLLGLFCATCVLSAKYDPSYVGGIGCTPTGKVNYTDCKVKQMTSTPTQATNGAGGKKYLWNFLELILALLTFFFVHSALL